MKHKIIDNHHAECIIISNKVNRGLNDENLIKVYNVIKKYGIDKLKKII